MICGSAPERKHGNRFQSLWFCLCAVFILVVFSVRFDLCPLMMTLKKSLYLWHTEDLVLDLCPAGYCMLISCMLHPCRGEKSRGWRKSGSNALTSSHCVAHSIPFSHFHLRSLIPSPSKHFIRSWTPILFLIWLSSEHRFFFFYPLLLSDCCSVFNNSWNVEVRNKVESLFFWLGVICATQVLNYES